MTEESHQHSLAGGDTEAQGSESPPAAEAERQEPDVTIILNQTLNATTPQLQVGRLSDARLRRALDAFVPPGGYFAARDRLASQRVVILEGPAGSGRTCAAINLAREVSPDARPYLVSAATPWETLASNDFVRSRPYLVTDHQVEVATEAVANEIDLHVGRLEEKLERAGAWLVVTREPQPLSTGRSGVIVLTPPSTDVLVRSYIDFLQVSLTDEERDSLAAHLAEERRPHRVASLLRAVARGDEVGATLEEDRQARRAVTDFFTANQRNADLAQAVTLAFFPGLPESRFDELAERLSRALDGPNEKSTKANVVQKRNDDPISTLSRLERRETEGATDTFRVPRRDEATGEILEHLVDLYGAPLWGPVREWLADIVDELDPEREADLRVCATLGRSLALLGRWRFEEITNTYLRAWVLRSVGPTDGRWWVGVMALSAFDAPPTHARNLAQEWSKSRQREVAAAGAFAFVLGLSARYPWSGLNAIWRYGSEFGDSPDPGGLLIATALSAAGSSASGEDLFRFLAAQMVAAKDRRTGRDQERPHQVAVRLLRTLDRPGGRPVCALLLENYPDTMSDFVKMVRGSLERAGSRGSMVRALAWFLCAADQSGDRSSESSRLATMAGEEMRRHLTPVQCADLQLDLHWVNQAHPCRERQSAIEMFLKCLNGSGALLQEAKSGDA